MSAILSQNKCPSILKVYTIGQSVAGENLYVGLIPVRLFLLLLLDSC